MAMSALERKQLSQQPAFIDRVASTVVSVARDIQLETAPAPRRIDLSYQALRHGPGLGETFARVISGFPHPVETGGTRLEVTYNSTDAHLKEAVREVWDFIAGSRLPDQG